MKSGKNIFVIFILISLCAVQFSIAQKLTKEDYTKKEVYIEMRDGIKLYTAIYTPKNSKQEYPIMLSRTTWGNRPYGEDKKHRYISYNKTMLAEGYIFVHQDVRGRFMSEGDFDNTRPVVSTTNPNAVDELTDTYDSVEWLLKNVRHNNGNVGVVGTSYPGFYAALSAISKHPAIKAVSPQAPVCDLFFDDIHRNGTFGIYFWPSLDAIGVQTPNNTDKWWDMYNLSKVKNKDGYDFYLNDLGSLKNSDKFMNPENFLWKQVVEHPNYDTFWQERNPLPHMKNINCEVLVVGGWNDMEDLYGTLGFFKAINKQNANVNPYLVIGPWAHGDYRYEKGTYAIGDLYFGENLTTYFQESIEAPFFSRYLKGNDKDVEIPKISLFDTGSLQWKHFKSYPKTTSNNTITYYTGENGKLTQNNPQTEDVEGISYVSDPNKPVPYSADRTLQKYSPKLFVAEDQRFASSRPDVITFSSETLKNDVQVYGAIEAALQVATDQTDADWMIKVIDVYPQEEVADSLKINKNALMEGYERIVRWDVIRGRFRESFENPKPFVPNQKTAVNLQLLDVMHTFKKGHKIMIQIQNSYFPYLDRNPQKYIPNIYKADDSDFTKANHTIYFDSHIKFNVVKSQNYKEKNKN
ncbi:CocE/NonD family hydrolase [uncultured Kordia sp.]|uniref:CocE/NonD family hydrolase n=1 Tax=uncultured Kordia sp. TaxID=507699 RepID=UPI002629B3AB|nr:CocE/NonD family hydrolase [uncultured Kordia sp.]